MSEMRQNHPSESGWCTLREEESVVPDVTVLVSRAPADIARCHVVRRAVFVDEQNVPAELEIDGRDSECTHFLAYVDGELLGCARMRVVDGVAKAERVAVHSPQRGLGIGRALMRQMEAVAREQGFSRIKLSAQVPVIPFYERIGYRCFGDEFVEAGIPHRWMDRDL